MNDKNIVYNVFNDYLIEIVNYIKIKYVGFKT